MPYCSGPENVIDSNRTLARIRTVPEDQVQEWQDDPSPSGGPGQGAPSLSGGAVLGAPAQSLTAPASTSRNWRFSPFNSPTGDAEAVSSARSLDNGWRRTASLSDNRDAAVMTDR